MKYVVILCAALFVAVIILIIKVVLLQRGFDELTENIEDQVSGSTNIPVTLTTSDKHARRTAVTLNREFRKLREERIRFEDGNRTVKNAVTGISHDLRTPLTAITAYLDLMDEEPDEKKRMEYLERIKNRTGSLTELTEELFKYSTVSDKTYETALNEGGDASPIDIRRSLEECLISFYAAFKAKDIEPEVDLPESPVIVLCNAKSANRIFENIIGNALKYAEGALSVKLTPDGCAVFENPASDLTPVIVAKLFDRYYTVREAAQSTGLGFSIARDLIEKNGGTIEASLNNNDLKITVRFMRYEDESSNT